MYNTELSFDVYKLGDEVIVENLENEMGKEISYSVDPKDVFELMEELQNKFGAEYDVVFRVQW